MSIVNERDHAAYAVKDLRRAVRLAELDLRAHRRAAKRAAAANTKLVKAHAALVEIESRIVQNMTMFGR